VFIPAYPPRDESRSTPNSRTYDEQYFEIDAESIDSLVVKATGKNVFRMFFALDAFAAYVI
jgi:hypothetical protein